MHETFPFASLPMEMKEMVLKKIENKDSLKLLQVNRQLRNYVLYWGPFYKKCFNEIEITIYDYLLEIELDEFMIEIKVSRGKKPNRNRRFARFYSKLIKTAHSYRRLSIKFMDTDARIMASNCLALTLRDFMPKDEHLKSFSINLSEPAELLQVLRLFNPVGIEEFELYTYDDFDLQDRRELSDLLESTLKSCKNVTINGDFRLFQPILKETNVETIIVDLIEQDDPMGVFRSIVSYGIPTRSTFAKIFLRMDRCWTDELRRVARAAKWDLCWDWIKRQNCMNMCTKAFGETFSRSLVNKRRSRMRDDNLVFDRYGDGKDYSFIYFPKERPNQPVPFLYFMATKGFRKSDF